MTGNLVNLVESGQNIPGLKAPARLLDNYSLINELRTRLINEVSLTDGLMRPREKIDIPFVQLLSETAINILEKVNVSSVIEKVKAYFSKELAHMDEWLAELQRDTYKQEECSIIPSECLSATKSAFDTCETDINDYYSQSLNFFKAVKNI